MIRTRIERWYRAARRRGAGFIALGDRVLLVAAWVLDARLRRELDLLRADPQARRALHDIVRREAQPGRQHRRLCGLPLTAADRRGTAIIIRLRPGPGLDLPDLLEQITRVAEEFRVAPERGSSLWVVIGRGPHQERLFLGHVLDGRALRFTLARLVAAHRLARGRPKS